MGSEAADGPTEIHIVVPVGAADAPPVARPADAGGADHGLREAASAAGQRLGLVALPAADVKAQLERTLREVSVILKAASEATFAKLTFESLEVGITISAKGSIGIATAGVDASLKLKFKPE